LQLAEEREVDVELLVVGAVERAHRRLRNATRRAYLRVIEDERRGPVLSFGLLEDPRPDILGAPENLRHELPHLIRGSTSRCLARFALRPDLLGDVDYGARIEAEKVRDDGDDDTADPEAPTDADPAAVLDVAACPLVA
jgi:hypothetical protein